MHFSDTTLTGLRSLSLQGKRAVLAAFGIVTGVLFIILLASIGRSAQRVILSQLNSLGVGTIVIFPGTGDNAALVPDKYGDALTFEDVESIGRLPQVAALAPVIYFPQTVSRGRENYDPLVVGTNEHYIPENSSGTPALGRLLSGEDVRRSRRVALLGWDVADKLFGREDPIGQKVKIRDMSFTVVGVLASKGTQFFQNPDARVYIPLPAAKILTNSSSCSMVALKAQGQTEAAVASIKSLLRRRHAIENPDDDPEKDDFFIQTPTEASNIVGPITDALSILLSLVASISLVVGGIGIMNVMFAAVKRRTREIGLRKALGAKDGDVLLQFLFETILLTGVSGGIGILLGVGSSFLAALVARWFLPEWELIIPLSSVLSAFGVSVAIGLLAGIFPSVRAAHMEPVEALRYE
ncbi:MAG: ABC transporter permease [Candidatus Peribacteraceae bacterium]|jgi:putative ABC transport system permease protein